MIGKIIRRQKFMRFIHSLEALPEMVAEFSENLWGRLVDHVTVHSEGNIIFTLTSGMEIKVYRNYGASPSGEALIFLWILGIRYGTINWTDCTRFVLLQGGLYAAKQHRNRRQNEVH